MEGSTASGQLYSCGFRSASSRRTSNRAFNEETSNEPTAPGSEAPDAAQGCVSLMGTQDLLSTAATSAAEGPLQQRSGGMQWPLSACLERTQPQATPRRALEPRELPGTACPRFSGQANSWLQGTQGQLAFRWLLAATINMRNCKITQHLCYRNLLRF